MASAKKKLDEYHLKILRQLVTLPSNKECFDCHQRGPTYVNVTIGSFVCTSCSGMLRGLTPPHRVKSISMATFTPDEVDFVKARGNEYCRKTWLGLLDSQPPTKDEQQVKDFMIAKYERKRYYLDPALDSTISKAVNGNSPSPSKPSTPSEAAHTVPALPTHTSVHPHPRTLAFKAPVSQPKSNNEFSPEPFADFSNLSIPPPCDPFNNSQSAAAPAQPSFANFDNNPVFNNSGSTGMPGVGEAGTVPGQDRYAALKDLDCLMKSQQTTETPPTEWSTGVSSNGMSSVWSAPSLFPAPAAQTQENVVSNPFKGGGTWINADSVSGSANPFRNNRPDAVWSNLSNGQLANGFTTSQSLNFTVPKTLRTNDAISNPFVIGPGPQVSGHHSSNPFL